jgi:hypothetical protein
MAADSNTTVTWKALVVCPHAEMGKRLAASLREILPQPPIVLSEYPRTGSLTGLAAKDGVNICFLDVATNSEHAQALISELAPEAPVVGLMLRKDADLILRCLRRGACEFLSEMGPDALRAVLARLATTQAPAPHGPAGKIWCVVPGKAGCGASTLAVHLAVQAREAGGPALLVDTDPLSASAAFLLKLKPEFHLGDMLRDSKRLDRELWSAHGSEQRDRRSRRARRPVGANRCGPPGGRSVHVLVGAVPDGGGRCGGCPFRGRKRLRPPRGYDSAGDDE